MATEKPKIEFTLRPFRLWYPQLEKKGTKVKGGYAKGRNYKYHENARTMAWIEAKRLPIGHSYEVIDGRTMKEIGTYTRRTNSVTFNPAQEKRNVQD